MANSTTNLDTMSVSQSAKETTANALFDAGSPAMLFGRRASTCVGLTWGYYGGALLVSGTPTAIGNGTVTLSPSTTNYVEATASGTVSKNTTGFTAGSVPLYTVVTGASSVTSYTDHRAILPFAVADRSILTALSIASGVVAIDVALGDYFTLALTANVTSITFSNLPASGHGASLMIRITQDSTARTVAWPASFKWANGLAGAVSTSSGAKDVLAITTFDQGTTWNATLAKAFA